MKKELTAEELRDKFRATTPVKRVLPTFLANIPIGNISLYDLISGPDDSLGPNQIQLREEIISKSVNDNLLTINATFTKKAESLPKDDVAKSFLTFFQKRNEPDAVEIIDDDLFLIND